MRIQWIKFLQRALQNGDTPCLVGEAFPDIILFVYIVATRCRGFSPCTDKGLVDERFDRFKEDHVRDEMEENVRRNAANAGTDV